MSTPAGQIVVSGTATPQNPATFQVTAAGRPTQTQVGLVPSTSPYAFYQQVPVNALAQGGITGSTLTFDGLTLAPNAPGWSLVSGQAGPGFVHGEWQYSFAPQIQGSPGTVDQGGNRVARGGSGSGGGMAIDNSEIVGAPSGFQLSGIGWVIVGLAVTLLLTDKKY